MYYDIKHLSRLDFHILNSSALEDIFYQITIHFRHSEFGWPSKNIVDACTFGLIEASNMKSESEDIGWLDVDDCTCVI